jgi:serpin B
MTKFIYIKILFLLLSLTSTGQDLTSTVKGNNTFAFDLYAKLKSERRSENLFFSPFSISSALAMTYAGARTETEIQMSKTLHFPLDQPMLHNSFNALIKKTEQKKDGIQLNIANSLWAQKDYKFLNDYFSLVKNKYSTSLEYVDFIDSEEREKARLKINSWVEGKTNDKIKELIKPDVLDAFSRLVLVNAIYFLGKWETEFKKEFTKLNSFFISPGKEIQVPFMKQTTDLKYFEDEKIQAVEIPYKGNTTSMVIILPRENKELERLEQTINNKKYLTILNSLSEKKVELTFPKFKTTKKFELKKTLADMGMPVAFSDDADFSGMTGQAELKNANVIHKAFVEVSEEGTEAAAATAVIMTLKEMKQENNIFKADHPFLFFIKDNETEGILFMGKIMNPNEE